MRAIKRLIASGTQLRSFSPEIMDACAKAAKELYEEIGAKNPTFKKLHDHMMAYRNEQILWQQVAEFNYDAYQIRSRSRRGPDDIRPPGWPSHPGSLSW